jgi:hypothetical protein
VLAFGVQELFLKWWCFVFFFNKEDDLNWVWSKLLRT